MATFHAHNLNILRQGAFAVPTAVLAPGQDARAFLASVFSRYLSGLDDFKGLLRDLLLDHRRLAEEIVASITAALDEYYRGHPATALERLSSGLEKFKAEQRLVNFAHSSFHTVVSNNVHGALFRARHVRKGTQPPRGPSEMFHIPFEQRHRVTTQRYSIPGLPCLYLCNSVWLCWEELGRPPLHEFYVSRVELELNAFCFLNLMATSHFAEQEDIGIEGDADRIDEHRAHVMASFIVRWPLIAACSIPRDYGIGAPPFVPQYVIPQLVLQWIAKQTRVAIHASKAQERPWDGVAYFSTRIPSIRGGFAGLYEDYAIPAKTVAPAGHCGELARHIRVTEPIQARTCRYNPWGRLSSRLSKEDWDRRAHAGSSLLSVDERGRKVDYWRTGFGLIEYQLSVRDALPI